MNAHSSQTAKVTGLSGNPDVLEQIPAWLRHHLGRQGAIIRLEQLSSRRGVTTLLTETDNAKQLVKLAEMTTDGAAANGAGVAREAAVLSSVDALRRRFEPALVETPEGVALLEAWIDGTLAFRDVKTPATADDEPALIDLLRLTLGELAVLHQVGWAHGDLQPLHFLVTGGGAVLLDYGVAQSVEMPMEDYRGGMVHFNAPEVAADIVATGTATASPASDVFALGSVFAFAVTGKVLGAYKMSAPWAEKLAVLAQGQLRTDLLREALAEVPTLSSILLALLAVDPAERPGDASAALRLLPVV